MLILLIISVSALIRSLLSSSLFPYTTLFRSRALRGGVRRPGAALRREFPASPVSPRARARRARAGHGGACYNGTMIYVVTYIYDSGRAETISDLRPRHRQFLTDLHASGGLIASGPWVGGPAGAYLLVAAGSEREALEMLDPDPFRAAGVIEERSVQGWDPVIGSL